MNKALDQTARRQALTVAYLGGGARYDAPLWPDHENFLQATVYEKVRFCRFPANFSKKWANLQLLGLIKRSKAKSVLASGGFAPLTPDQELCPGPRWGLRPQTSVIGSRSARSPWPHFAKS